MTTKTKGSRYAAIHARMAEKATPTKEQRKAAVELPRPKTAMAEAVTKAAVKKVVKQAEATGISVNANLFRIAALACSTDPTRYYLEGVYCEPHAKGGVNLVATDGHVLVCLHDPDGSCDKAAIIRLSKPALQACKLDKDERQVRNAKRTLTLDPQTRTATVLNAFSQPVASHPRAEIDATFPNYRGVVPVPTKRVTACFNGNLLTRMCQIGKELGAEMNGIAVHSDDKGGAALVLWDGVDFGFGVIMPLRAGTATTDGIMPSFYGNN